MNDDNKASVAPALVPGWSSVWSGCLALSGAAALIYEVVWLRRVALIMGHTSYATAALLSAFLGGLAGGAFIAARWLRRHQPTPRTYAGLEACVLVCALAVPALSAALSPAFGAAYRAWGAHPTAHAALQFGLCAMILVVPTALMGATLPVVVACEAGADERFVGTTGRLYAANTLGGMIGAAVAGLWLIPTFGETRATYFAAGLNAFAALFALTGASRRAAAPSTRPTAAGWRGPSAPAVLVLYGLSGAAALAVQVAWARIIGLSVGSTLYGFTVTLVAFIAGLGVGSALLPRWPALARNPVRGLFGLSLFVAVSVAATTVALGEVPSLVARIMADASSFAWTLTAELGVALLTILAPTLAMGGLFPLVAAVVRAEARGDAAAGGIAVGHVYTANTVGTIVGATVAGFVAIPMLGSQTTLHVAAIATALIGIGFAARALPDSSRGQMAAVGGLGTVTLLAFGPRWSPDAITSAPYLGQYQMTAGTDGKPLGELVDLEEGASTLASVRRWPNRVRALYSGGVLESTSHAPTHEYLAHLPLVLAPSPKRVLVVGLGAGNTLAAVTRHGSVESIECIEIAPEVIALATEHFPELLGPALQDPRVRLRVGDGRAHVAYTNALYDVIISQPSYPWAAGAARLFTREYFADLSRRLAPGGIAVVWFADESPPHTASVLAAWRAEFPESHLFTPSRNFPMFFAVGFKGSADFDPRRLTETMAEPRVAAAMTRLGFATPQALLATRVADAQRVAEMASRAVVNTDDNGYVELGLFRVLTTRRWQR